MKRGTMFGLPVLLIAVGMLLIGACGGDSEKATATGDDADDDAPLIDDDDGDDDDSYEGEPCTISFQCVSGSCGDLPCWEVGPATGCEAACYVLSTPEGNVNGYCVPPCTGDDACPGDWFCLPECPDLELWFDPRWCVQNEYDFMRECPDF